MALPASGQISLGDIATEKGGSLDNVSLTTESTTGINTNSPSFPDGATPHAISEFYSYDHSAGGVSYTTLTIDGTNTYTINSDSIESSGQQFDMIHATGSTDNIIYAHRGNTSAFCNIGGLVIDANGAIQSAGTPTELHPNVGGSSVICEVSSSGRYISVIRDNNASGFVRARLFDYDTSTQTVTLQGSLTNLYSTRTNNTITDLAPISDSYVLAISNRGGTGFGAHRVIISGTSLTVNNYYNTFNISAGASTTKFMKTGDTTGFILTQRRTATHNRYIDYVAVTNLTAPTAPTYGSRTQLIDVGVDSVTAQGVQYVGNNYGLICYSPSSVLGGDGRHHVHLLSGSGTTLTAVSEITSSATSANDSIRTAVHDIILMPTVGDLTYFVSKCAGEFAILGSVDTSTGTLTYLDETSSFAPSFFGEGSMINVSADNSSTNFIVLGSTSTSLTALTASIS